MNSLIIKISIIFTIVAFVIFSSCSSEKKDKVETLDLMSYGVPIKVKAPIGTEVKTVDMGIYTDITLKNGDDYSIQIISTSATTNDIGKIKAERLEEVKKNPYFSKVILDEKNGFVFEKKLTDSTYNFGFRYIKVQGDNEFSFQTGLYGLFTKDQTMTMYESVK
jgi:hypothetical protein